MTIQTHVTDRKALAKSISEEIHEPVQFLGVPTCSYQVGPYTVDRDAVIHGDDLEPLRPFLLRHGYIAEGQELTGQADSEAVPLRDNFLSVPFPGFTAQWLGNLLRILYTRQALLTAMLRSDLYAISDDLVTSLDDQADDLQRIAGLLCLVPGIRLEDGKLFFELPEDQDRMMACADLLMALISHAKESHRVRMKRIEPADSEMKYHCYSWLVQLGLSGADYKATRKILLQGIPGYAAFSTTDKMEAHKARITERRRAAKWTEVNSDD